MSSLCDCWCRLKISTVFISSLISCLLFYFFISIYSTTSRTANDNLNYRIGHNLKIHEKFKSAPSFDSASDKYEHENIADILPLTISESNTGSSKDKTPNSVILTSWFTYSKDPQRGKRVPQTIEYIWNFYITARSLGVKVVIFHNHLRAEFVSKYKTDKISFEKIVPSKSFSTNDLRFIIYEDFLRKHPHDWILMTDASDVFFNRNPFVDMSQNQNNTSLYLSPDIGTFRSSRWMKRKMQQCYPYRIKSWIHEWNLELFNAGVWGGHRSAVSCILKCIINDLTKTLKGRGNCNMGTVNWCIRFGGCADKKDLAIDQVKAGFVNPFREDCENRTYSIIHNKCEETEGTICAVIKDNIIKFKRNDGKSCHIFNR